jgi:hypothetical protein
MIITLSNEKQIEITGINLRNAVIDFKWVDGVYSGDCCFPISITEGQIPTEAEIQAATELALVTDTENKVL